MLSKKEQSLGAIISFLAIVLVLVYLIFSLVGFDDEVILLAAMGAILIVTFCLRFFVLRSLRKQNKIAEIDYLNIGTQRYILGLMMIFYGIPKLFGSFFDYQLFALDSKLTDVSEFELAWYYFGKNRWQELFAGIMEFVPGLLLLNRRTYYVAALILFPVTAQVFILNLFFKIGGVTFPAATILLACNAYIIYSQKEKIIQFFRALNFSPTINLNSRARVLVKTGRWIVFVLAALLLFINVKRSFFKTDTQVKYGSLVGVYTFEKMTKNKTIYKPTNDSIFYKDLYIEKQSRWNLLRRFNDKTDAFILDVNSKNDSLKIYINKGGIGDNADIIDSLSLLKGTYKLDHDKLIIKGIQYSDTLELDYTKRNIQAKNWFW